MPSEKEIQEIMDVLVPDDYGDYGDVEQSIELHAPVARRVDTDSPDDKSRTDDYNYARDIMYDAIEKGNEAFSEALKVAIETKSPRCFEVTAQLMSNVTSSAKELMNLAHTHVKVEKEANAKESGEPGDNKTYLHVGSTEELAKLLGPRQLTPDDAIIIKEKDDEKTNSSKD